MTPVVPISAPAPPGEKPAPSVRVMLDKVRTMTLDFNALTLIEEVTGKSLLSGQIRELTASDIRSIFFACLAQEDPTLTLEEVGRYLMPGHFPEAIDIILRLLLGDSDPQVLAPFVATPQEVVEAALELAKVGGEDILYDLGCGDGRVVIAASKRGARAVGIENSPERAQIARLALEVEETLAKRILPVVIREGLVQEQKLEEASVIFVYLLTSSNTKIRPQLSRDLRPGTRIISHDFTFPGWVAEDSVQMESGGRSHAIYLYRYGSHAPVAPTPTAFPEAPPAPAEASAPDHQ
jgi:SAM-dependent methyltransferase